MAIPQSYTVRGANPNNNNRKISITHTLLIKEHALMRLQIRTRYGQHIGGTEKQTTYYALLKDKQQYL